MRHNAVLGPIAPLAIAGMAALLVGCDEGAAAGVSGTISLPVGAAAEVRESDSLFIVARPAGEPDAPPVAVQRVVGMRFPLDYAIGPEDAMAPGRPFVGPVEVKAILRRSGLANMPLPGDREGRAKGPVALGTRGADVVLDTPSR